jgi:tRNA threonylcarbamoyl adenosine modification protein YeaZ
LWLCHVKGKIPRMKLLAVDTTSYAGSVAMLDGDEIRGLIGIHAVPGHAERLLPTIDMLLKELELSLEDIEAFAVAAGPGSFTGLRIGISTVEGLSYSTERPVVGVSSLEATAYHFRYRAGLVASFLDARRGEIFGALYRGDGKSLDTVGEAVCEKPDVFLNRLPAEPVLIAGSGTLTYRELLENHPKVQPADPAFFLAEEVGRIGRRRIREGRATPLGGLEAIYLRPSDAEKARKVKP